MTDLNDRLDRAAISGVEERAETFKKRREVRKRRANDGDPDLLDYSREEVQDILSYTLKRVGNFDSLKYYTMFSLAYLHGLRREELISMRAEDVDLKDKRKPRIYIRRVKGSESKWYPMSNSEVDLVEQWLLHRRIHYTESPTGIMFPVSGERRYKIGAVPKIFMEIVRDLGLNKNGRSLKSLRHSITVHMLDAGIPIVQVQDWLGHREIGSTMKYARVTDKARRMTMGAMTLNEADIVQVGPVQPKIKKKRRLLKVA